MGCTCSMTSKIDSLQTTSDYQYKSKILVVGTSNSGKSTLLRQMQIINTSGFSAADRDTYKHIIVENVTSCIKFLLEKNDIADVGSESIALERARADFRLLIEDGKCHLPVVEEELLALASTIWKDPAMKRLFNESKDEFENFDSLSSLMSDIDEMTKKDYVPSNSQILLCRIPTTGVRSLKFDFDELPLEMIDVGGQRSERRKWIHCFDDVQVLLFCVSANEYDMMLQEDASKNAMVESMQVFKSLINSVWFRMKPIVLFLNKIDLLEKKIVESSIADYFPDFDGNSSQYLDVIAFIKSKYLESDEQHKRIIYCFNTCATDTVNIQRISVVCFSSLFNQTLTNIGLN